jgi:Rps23 Pro-64 3,4-dihydroxylase Tpa1-like proline 4-hydroxylase
VLFQHERFRRSNANPPARVLKRAVAIKARAARLATSTPRLKPMFRLHDCDSLRASFMRGNPFSHLVIDDFLDKQWALEAAAAFPDFGRAARVGLTFDELNEQRKVQISDVSQFPAPIVRLHQALCSKEFLSALSCVTMIPDLIPDERLSGGGMHLTGSGGRLDVHVDFNYDEATQLHRRLNLIVYFNPIWQDHWGGEIELWDSRVRRCGARMKPLLNRCLVFETTRTSFHGVRPIRGPADVIRKSFAAYYYTRAPPPGWCGEKHSTIFRARPSEPLRKFVLMPGAGIWRWAAMRIRRLRWSLRRLMR